MKCPKLSFNPRGIGWMIAITDHKWRRAGPGRAVEFLRHPDHYHEWRRTRWRNKGGNRLYGRLFMYQICAVELANGRGRITPAHAGNADTHKMIAHRDQDHPHTRGMNSCTMSAFFECSGVGPKNIIFDGGTVENRIYCFVAFIT